MGQQVGRTRRLSHPFEDGWKADQALNWVPTGGGVPLGRINQIWDERGHRYEAGDYRRDIFAQRMVELVQKLMPGAGKIKWVVRDVLSDEEYIVHEDNLGKNTFNEMEVIAWAAR